MITPKQIADGVLVAHMAEMQDMLRRYLAPGTYRAENGMMASSRGDQIMRDKLFISDMIFVLDAEAERPPRAALEEG